MTIDIKGLRMIVTTLGQIEEALNSPYGDADTAWKVRSAGLNLGTLADDIHDVKHKINDIIREAN